MSKSMASAFFSSPSAACWQTLILEAGVFIRTALIHNSPLSGTNQVHANTARRVGNSEPCARSFISRISHHILLSHIHIYIFHIYISMGIARLLGATAIGATAAPHHILCLHGGGTNAAIMKLQTSKLRHQLRDFAGKGSNQALAEPT